MSLAQVVDVYAAKTIDAETYISRDGMEDWLPPFEIAEIKAALEARGLSPRTNEGAEAPAAVPVSGAWREPGKWDGGGGSNFDDVTVAMAAPKAQELLDAFSSDNEATAVLSALTEQPERAAPRPAAGLPAEPTPAEEPPAAAMFPQAAASAERDIAPPARAEKKDLFAAAAEAEDAPRGRLPSASGEAPRARMPSASGEAPRARMPSASGDAPRGRLPSVSDEAPRSRMPSIPPEASGQGSLDRSA